MCSSPKSNGNAKPSNISVKGVFGGVSRSSREHFAAVANAAEDRREQARVDSKIKQSKANLAKTRRFNQISAKDRSKPPIPSSGYSLAWIFKKDLLSFFVR